MKTLLALIIFILMVTSVFGSTLSITEPDYITFQNDLAKPAWKVSTLGSNDAEYIVAVDAKSLTGDVDGAPAHSKYDFSLKTEIVSETCNYGLVQDNNLRDVYTYEIVHKPSVQFWNLDSEFQACSEKGAYLWYYTNQGVTTRNVYCAYRTRQAVTGNVLEGQMNFNAKFTLQREGRLPVVQQITTLAADKSEIPTSVFFKEGNNNVALVKWTGFGATSGEFCPGQDQLISLETTGLSQNRKYMGSSALFQEYVTRNILFQNVQDNIFDIIYDTGTHISSDLNLVFQSMAQQNNLAAQNALTEQQIATGSSRSVIQGSQAVLSLNRGHLIYAPLFDIFVWKDYLQVVYEVGDPEISGIRFNDCSENAQTANRVIVDIFNKGQGSSEVSTGISCSSGISLQTNSRKITIPAGQSGTVEFPFTLSIPNDQALSCQVTVIDSNYPDNKDSKSTSAQCLSTVICQEGEVKCGGVKTYECENNRYVEQPDRFDCASEICGDNIDNDGDKLIDEGCGPVPEACENVQCIQNNQCVFPETKQCCPSECGDICNYNGEGEPLLGETPENCRNDFLTCNYDNVCDRTGNAPEDENSCPADCQTRQDFNPVYVAGGIVAAVGIGLYLIRYQRKRKK